MLKSNYFKIKIKENKIIGVMGPNYDRFLVSIKGDNISYIGKIDNFYTNKVIDEINLYERDFKVINYYLNILMLNNEFLDKKISNLSSGERHLLRYIIGFVQNKKIIVIDEPFLDLDYEWKKRIIVLLRDIIKDKTVIVGSFNSDIIYSLVSIVLLIGDNNYFYGDVKDVFTNYDILSMYHIKMPQIVQFVDLIRRDKNVMIDYSNDIRDLIKDVYKNV